jgi:hypothetical protein
VERENTHLARRLPSPTLTRRATAAALALAALGVLLAPASASAGERVRLGVAVHVAQEGGLPVAERAFIERQLTMANRGFAPYGVAFEQSERQQSDALLAHLQTRSDRNALGAFVRPQLINLFVVASLRDVDEPPRIRRGVHWHSATHAPAHYVILSRISFDAVLAHELRHFLGNPGHSITRGNLMSYQHTEQLPFLDEAQQRRLRDCLAGYLRTGELRPLGPAPQR